MWAIAIFLLISRVLSQTINSTIETNWWTQCKRCPDNLCVNVWNYKVEEGTGNLTLTCWTRGQVIDGDSTWLRTSDNCYVSQYDLVEYPGEYTEDLPYCGADSETISLTPQPVLLQYHTECFISPNLGTDVVHYHKYGTPLTVTCITASESTIFRDNAWLRTTDNCYVAQAGLTEEVVLETIDDCGPVPVLLYQNVTFPVEPEDPSEPEDPTTDLKKSIAEEHRLGKRWLYDTPVGEESSVCYTEPLTSSEVVETYNYLQLILSQCIVRVPEADGLETVWAFTQDFCYVKTSDLWDPPEYSSNRYPLCEYFV